MPYLVIEDFRLGLDRRKSIITAAAGSLWVGDNCHITSGGEVEKRLAFVPDGALPAGTVGLAVVNGVPTVFGHTAAPGGIPVGYAYQRLQHPTPNTALSRILDWDVYNGTLYVVGLFADGSIFHFYDGARVTDWFDGRARASFQITGGTASAGVNRVTSIKVNGVEVLGAAVDWVTSNDATATAIAAQVNAFTSSPDYTAVAVGDVVNVIATAAGTAENGRAVTITAAGNVTLSLSSTTMSGGVSGSTFTPGASVLTFRSKIYSTSGRLLHFSGVNNPTGWQSSVTGAGAINLNTQDGDAEDLISLETYYNQLAVFGRYSVQLWNVAADPAQNAQAQILRNIGTLAPNSVAQFGNADVFFLSDNGLRSLRARDASNAASVNDVGTPIDNLLVEAIRTDPTSAARATGLVDPVTGRYWLSIGSTIFVFSFYPASKITAWSTYSPGFAIDAMAVANNAVLVRSGNTVYRYGGANRDVYGSDYLVDVVIPLADASKPATRKALQGLDLSCEGTWTVYVGTQPDNPSARDPAATVTGPTFGLNVIPIIGHGTHFSVRMTHQGAGAARLHNLILHYETGEKG